MNSRFNQFANSPLGLQIKSIIDQSNRQVELNAFSREGFPAVTALVSQLSPVLLPLRQSDPKKFNFAKQFVGAYVGDMMLADGHTMVRAARSVPGKLFSVGAVWSA